MQDADEELVMVAGDGFFVDFIYLEAIILSAYYN